ncbi:MAG TPA: glycoside hydrolase family 2 TIM barrel-domain containing protein [Pyrinomonadaceae bacterium]|nr:glycoside hydrolase family 2 TIM barrel-domain containing protein [Pyrinomonadaceae bacterium]
MEQSLLNIPRPEYPRPQFVRADWLNLNGEWEFAFDDANKGREKGWHFGLTLEKRITVPFPYQAEASGINDKGIHEYVWYARSFMVPPEWRGQNVLLHFGAVDYRTTVWINGKEVGHNQGGHVPFQFNIAPYLNHEQNRLTLRVEDRQNPRQPRGKQSTTARPHDIDYYCTTGIWQTVWLERVPPIRIQDMKINSSASAGTIEINALLHAPAARWRLEAEASDEDKIVARTSVEICAATAQLKLEIPEPRPWSPASPNLYDLRVRLYEGDQLLDEVASYTGLRDLELREGRVWLNGRPVYLAMVLDQGYWPESYLAAPSDDALRRDVEWIKRFGFNGARKHQKIEDPRWLYWCDRLGLLVWEEMPNAREWSSQAEERLAAEWKRAIHRDYNHPCIISWVPVNESMGFPKLRQNHPGQYAFIERMVAMTRELDAGRPVIDNDGWEHTDITDICAIHDYTPTAALLRERYQDAVGGGALPAHVWLANKPLFVLGSRYRGQPIILSEVGGFLMIPPDLPPEKRDLLYRFYGSVHNPEELLAKYRDLMEGILSLRFVAGFCYTQLTDIEQEINGLLTYDRRAKVPPEEIAEIHRRLFELDEAKDVSETEAAVTELR